MEIYERLESEVRSYCRDFPIELTTAQGSMVFDKNGNQYIDFLMGSGSLNYGHNEPKMKRALINYIEQNGITTTMDFHSLAKTKFIKAFDRVILKPKNLNYKLQFCGPTGTNAVEAALKLAQKITGRHTLCSFTNAFHGCTLGSLSVSDNPEKRGNYPLLNVIKLPFYGYSSDNSIYDHYFTNVLEKNLEGIEYPAAIILETVQGEGGINVASNEWLKEIERLARKIGALIIVDDIQAGCGRTGNFFSFENSDLQPDIVVLSKSISGYGLPMSLLLMRDNLDCWKPGEHNGTFRGNNHAFVTGTVALEEYWGNIKFHEKLQHNIFILDKNIREIASKHQVIPKGIGMFRGLEMGSEKKAKLIQKSCFEGGLIIERCGPNNNVIKLLPPLNIDPPLLERGCKIIDEALSKSLS